MKLREVEKRALSVFFIVISTCVLLNKIIVVVVRKFVLRKQRSIFFVERILLTDVNILGIPVFVIQTFSIKVASLLAQFVNPSLSLF